MAESVLICGQCGRTVIAGPAACPHCAAPLKGSGARVATATPSSTAAVLLLVLGTAAAGFGLILSSQASAGASLAAVGCFLGIAARLAQASNHQKNLLALLVREGAMRDTAGRGPGSKPEASPQA